MPKTAGLHTSDWALLCPQETAGFDFELNNRVVFGRGVLSALGTEAANFGGKRILVVTDAGVKAAGHLDTALRSLREKGLNYSVFEGVAENPTDENVNAGVKAAAECGAEIIVGLGGGSALDCSKAINLVVTNGGRIADYWGWGKAEHALLPSLGIPTTAGTGSESQSYALITDSKSHRKMACGDRKARFGTVLLDPELVLTAPHAVKTATAFDAISHAVESAVCRVSTPFSRMLALEAWTRLESSLEGFLQGSLGAAGEMLLGAHFAGAAIEASMLGAAHACANPLTARFGVVHGIAVSVMLPHVVEFNGEEHPQRFRPFDSFLSLAQRLRQFQEFAGTPSSLRELGIPEGELGALAEAAEREWTGGFNPRPVGKAELLELYRRAH